MGPVGGGAWGEISERPGRLIKKALAIKTPILRT